MARFGIMLLALFAPLRVAQAQTPYTFTKIADSNQIQNLGGINCVGIGNSGTVIIVTNAQLWRGDGQSDPSQVVLTSPLGGGCASINDQDEIAYVINTPSFPYTRLVRNFNGTTTELATSGQSPYLYSTYNPSLTKNGSAVFHGGPSAACGGSGGSNHGVYIGPGGAIVYDPICDQAADIRGDSVLAGTMNDNLVVAFYAQNKDVPALQGIYRGSLTPLVQDGVNGIALINSPQRPVINNSGIVAFLGTLNAGPASIYTTSDGVSFTRAGQFPNNNGLFAINDSGKVVYTITGSIYTGPDLVADKVIVTGSQLDGSVFLGGFTYLQSINNSGQVAFFAQLGDCATCPTNRYGVYRANPNRPPVASDGTASVTAGASVSGTLSATDPDGDSLTYSIVTNGTKGTAVITNTGTGAYTYTANVGSSGTDTFTFKASDGLLDSNTATIIVTITSGICAADISTTVAITSQGPLKLNKKTGRYTSTLTLKNGDGAVSGPVSLVLDNLSSNATLFNSIGTTACAAPSGSPYINVDIGSDSVFSPRERGTATLEFTNPSGQAVTYTPRVVAGAGNR